MVHKKSQGLDYDFDLTGKSVKLIKGDFVGRKGVITAVTGYTEGYGAVAKIKLSSGKIVEFPADFWEEI
jgi:hypothetical protein